MAQFHSYSVNKNPVIWATVTSEIKDPGILIQKKKICDAAYVWKDFGCIFLARIMGPRGKTEQGSPRQGRDGDGETICPFLILFTIICPFFKTYFACKRVCLAFILATYVALFEPQAHEHVAVTCHLNRMKFAGQRLKGTWDWLRTE